KTTSPPKAGPLDGIPLKPEDRRFIHSHIDDRPDRRALITEYAARWRSAAAAEPTPHKRDNAGRRSANYWLLQRLSHEEKPETTSY
ncbi:MAG: hypothetical protein ABR558_06775, partial [Thioalkalivibrio sp.]